MTNLNIDRLTLNLPALSQSDGQRLARQIAEGLTSGVITSEATREAPNIHITIPADSNTDDVDWLAHQIVAEVLQQLNQTLG
jgi:hypothetical protein